MKRTILTGLAVIAVAALAMIPVMAQPQGRGAGRGMGMGPGGPGGGPGGPFPMLRELNLTDAQREQIRTITEEHRSDNPPQARVADLERQLQMAILGDGQKIDELKAALIAAHNEALTERIDIQSRIAQVLTPEQRAKGKELLSQMPEGRGRGRGPGRGPGGGPGFGLLHWLR